jgi:pimeloyl-ACP methyl ester carboxylesterase
VAFDQRGHGESGDDTGGHIESFGDDTAAMLENLVAPIAVGASLGGFAALMALRARAVRDNVAGLVLVDVIPDPDPEIVRPFLASIGRDLVKSPLVQDIFDHSDTLRNAASCLDLPVLLVRAGRGTPISDEALDRLRVVVPHLQVASIAEAGHLVARDAPSALADVLTAFLNDDTVRAKRINSMLFRCGCVEIAHPGGTLFAHLNRVAETLRSWKSDRIMVDAAHLHAA